MREQATGEALEVMRIVKQLLDPLGAMNPGKVFTFDRACPP